MAVVYSGVHSIHFIQAEDIADDATLSYGSSRKNSWTDFHLIPVNRPHIETPIIYYDTYSSNVSNTIYYILSRNGDYVLANKRFPPRKGNWEFIVDHEKWSSWAVAKRTIENYINGKRLYVVLDDDRTKAYRGRLIVSSWDDGSDYSHITISYDLNYNTYTCSINF